MVKFIESKKLEDLLKFCIAFAVLLWINSISNIYYKRIDLTEEGRYTIKDASKELLSSLDDEVYIEVFLAGELNAGFKRLQKSVLETLEEFSLHSNGKVRYTITDPSTAVSVQARNEYMQDLASKGITPTNVIDTQDGQRIEKIIFPGATVAYQGQELPVMLLKGVRGEEQLNNSIENIEYELISTLYRLTLIKRKTIGFSSKHNETDSLHSFSFRNSLLDYYNVRDIDLKKGIPSVDLVILSKPQMHFDELEKFHLDQYIMQGGKVIFLLDKLEALMDSASSNENFAFPYDMNLDDLLFRYGVRINADLIQDNYAATYPIVTNTVGGQPQIMKLPWPFYPIINQLPNHTITKNLEAVLLRFASTIDTVKATGIRKTPLLFTSQYSRAVNAPVQVTVNDLRKNLNPEKLNMSYMPVAYLLEGSFTSVFKNRILPETADSDLFHDEGKETKILVVSDGDIIMNDINPSSREPFQLGDYPYMAGVHFGNLDFMMNALSFMLNENGIISAKNKEIAIRPLDKVKIANEKTKWQLINLLLPIAIINLLGVLLYYIRKKKYSQFKSDQ